MGAQPLVVWAIQSPTLINRLAKSTKWRLRAADLGDANGFLERQLLDTQKWQREDGDPAAVFVCSPMQMHNARALWPSAKVIMVAHQGYPFRILPLLLEADGIATFAGVHARALREVTGKPTSELVPVFEPCPAWKWSPGRLWTVLSRPSMRHPMAAAGVQEILYLLAERRSVPMLQHTWYGQDQPGGFLDEAGIASRRASCSAYLSMLPPASGLGLVEHECMAAGVPLVGARWANLLEFNPLPHLSDYFSFDSICTDCERLCEHESFGGAASEAGLDYISDCFNSHGMERSVESALAEWEV